MKLLDFLMVYEGTCSVSVDFVTDRPDPVTREYVVPCTGDIPQLSPVVLNSEVLRIRRHKGLTHVDAEA